jgi:hypothetical protein
VVLLAIPIGLNKNIFYINSKESTYSNLTSLQAVQQFGGAPSNIFEISDSDSENRNGGGIIFGTPGVWARIHTIFYRPGKKNPSCGQASVVDQVPYSQSLLVFLT